MEEKSARRKQHILQTVIQTLDECDYSRLTIEELASRAGVGKSTIYRWWKHKSDLIFDAFKLETESVFDLDFQQSLRFNLLQQLGRLSQVLARGIGRALLVVIAEQRDVAGKFFQQYLLPRREQIHALIQLAIEHQEIQADYDFEMMLDTLYAPLHYQIIFFNRIPDEDYIQHLVEFVLRPIAIQ